MRKCVDTMLLCSAPVALYLVLGAMAAYKSPDWASFNWMTGFAAKAVGITGLIGGISCILSSRSFWKFSEAISNATQSGALARHAARRAAHGRR